MKGVIFVCAMLGTCTTRSNDIFHMFLFFAIMIMSAC